MPIKLKNRSKLPDIDFETVTALGLEIPKTQRFPFGGQVALVDLQNRFAAAEVGEFEFLMRLFCLFTWRLPKGEHVRYEWLAAQDLEADEISEIIAAANELLKHLNTPAEGEEGQKKAVRNKTKN